MTASQMDRRRFILVDLGKPLPDQQLDRTAYRVLGLVVSSDSTGEVQVVFSAQMSDGTVQLTTYWLDLSQPWLQRLNSKKASPTSEDVQRRPGSAILRPIDAKVVADVAAGRAAPPAWTKIEH